MFKIALDAGHWYGEAGRRCLKALDYNETREWTLNDRICDRVEKLLAAYDGYQLLRVDDTTGKTEPSLSARCKAANNFGADFYLSIHHNAGVNGGSGGGIEAFAYAEGGEGAEWRDDLYTALIKATGLKGNRSQPKRTANFQVLRDTKAPAVLLELGFMDSKTDVPIIVTSEYADDCAAAIAGVIVKRGKLTKKPSAVKALYKVQVGAFSKKENAEALAAELKAQGYQTFIVKA